MISSYSKIYTVTHKATDLLRGAQVLVQEKVDGSQFSFTKDAQGNLHFRSKNALVFAKAPGMFGHAVRAITEIKELLQPGWIYRGEYLQKPKHNVLTYASVPPRHVVLYDICEEGERYKDWMDVAAEAARLGLQVVPTYYTGEMPKIEELQKFLELTSVLGGCKIEGVVVKPLNYDVFDTDKKVLMAKLVSDDFKEVHRKEWTGAAGAAGKSGVERVFEQYCTPARWRKAVQHLAELGQLQNAPQDIGPLIKRVQMDVVQECIEEVKAELYKLYEGDFLRKVVAGLPEWYKRELQKGTEEPQ